MEETRLDLILRGIRVILYDEAIDRFMNHPQQRWEGRSPLDLMADGRADELLEYLGSLADSSFS